VLQMVGRGPVQSSDVFLWTVIRLTVMLRLLLVLVLLLILQCAGLLATVHIGVSRLRTQTLRSSAHSRTTEACGCGTTCPCRSASRQCLRLASRWRQMRRCCTDRATHTGDG
jgi:hypothetical protein